MIPRKCELGRYAASAAGVGLAASLRAVLAPWLGPLAPFPTLLASVALAAGFGGIGPGLAAASLATIASTAFLGPGLASAWPPAPEGFALALFAGSSVVVAVGCGFWRSSGTGHRALDRYRLLSENARDIALFIRPGDGRIVEANDAAVAAYGHPRRDLLGLTVRDLRAPEKMPDLDDQMASVDDDAGATFETVHRRRDGSTFPVEVSSRGAEVAGERLLLSLIRDITARKEIEEDLRRAERRLRALVDGVLQLVWVNEPDGRTTFYNRRWEEFSGRDPRLVAQGWFDLVHPDDRDALLATRAAGIASGGPYEAEYRLLRRDGRYRWMLAWTVPVKDVDGRVENWFGTATDIDDRKLAEEALRASRDLAEAGTRARDQFLAVLSHELRNPLMPVLVSVSALLDDPDTAESVRPTLELARRNVELEARLIDDLLDVTRIAQGKLRLAVEPVDARDAIARAVEICRDEIAAKGLRLSIDLDPLPHAVKADPARLQQVLWNLIKNAAKFTPAGGSIALRSRVEGPRLAVEVVDDGIGIGPDVLPRIFSAFEQGDEAVTRRFGGLGLGLAISRSLAEAHGGSLTATSPGPGLGASFTLDLPTTTEALPAPAAGPSRGGAPVAPLRILVVEDNPDSRRVLSRLLERRGHRVASAGCVEDALRAVDGDSFDLVISDIGLPDGTGHDLMRAVRPRVRLGGIALSGFGMDHDLRRSDESGFLAHLTKPVDFAHLEEAIRNAAGPG